jgi:hemerythrin-like metal-binding protein
LVIDDDAGIREVIADALQLEGIDVVPARGGAEAIAALDAGCRPDVVLLDLLMPGISGERLLPMLRQHPAAGAVPVLIMSASPERLARIEGADARLPKPFHLDMLLETIDRLCSARPGDGLVLGIPGVDEQHRRQLDLAGSLHDALVGGAGERRATELLDELIDFTQDHFANEGELMRRHAYPEASAHLREHARQVEELGRWRKAAGAMRDAIALKAGLEVHVGTMDRDLARYLSTRGVQ